MPVFSSTPSTWTKDARRQYASIVFSTAVIHFPLGLAFVISGILLGFLTYYLDLTLGCLLLLSGTVAIFSTKVPIDITILFSCLTSMASGLASISLFFTMLVLTFVVKRDEDLRLVASNPLVWIYFIFSTSAFSLEILQLYFEFKAMQQPATMRRIGSACGGYVASPGPSSDQGVKPAVTERTECIVTTAQPQQWMPMSPTQKEVPNSSESN